MKNWFKINFKNTVTRFMVSYSIVLLLPLVLCMIGYQISFNIVEEGIKDTNLAMINQGRDIIDNELLAINSIVMQISTNSKVNSLTETSNRAKFGFYQDVRESIKLLSNLTLHSTVSVIDRIYIYLRDTDYIITPETLYRSDFYNEYILNDTKSLFEDWKEGLFNEFNYGKYIINNSEIDYIQSIPFSYNADPKGVVVVTVKKDKLTRFFSGLAERTDKGSFMYVQDKNGDIITSLSKDGALPGYVDFTGISDKEGFFKQKVGNQNMIVVHTISNVNQWKYVLVMPEKVVMSELVAFQRTILIIFFIALSIGIIISYYMAYRNWRPLNGIVQQLKEFIVEDGNRVGDTFEKLGGAVSTLLINNQTLASEIEKQQPLVQAAFLQKLIKGEFTNSNEIEIISESAGIDISFNKLLVLTFRIFVHNDRDIIDRETLKELNIARIVTKEALKKNIGEEIYFYDIDHFTSAAIVGIDKLVHIKSEVETILDNTTLDIFREHGIKPFFGISNKCTNVLGIWRSYEESKTALNVVVKKQDTNFMWYNNVHQVGTKYYYPLDFEQRLIKHAKAGEFENIKNLLDILYVENFEKRKLENPTIDKLYNEVISTIVKLTQPNTDPELIDRLNTFIGQSDKEIIIKFFEAITTAYSEISSSYNQDKTSRHLQMINSIKEYIKSIYNDPELCLSMVASEFNISEGYLSFFFKEQTGINFTDYVENLRINKACELLKDNTLTISEIGDMVGYNSVQSFRRAFKRIQGVSPSVMRKNK